MNENLNKNAFQYDAYHPLQWPSRRVGCLPRAGVCPGGCLPVGVVSIWSDASFTFAFTRHECTLTVNFNDAAQTPVRNGFPTKLSNQPESVKYQCGLILVPCWRQKLAINVEHLKIYYLRGMRIQKGLKHARSVSVVSWPICIKPWTNWQNYLSVISYGT